MDVSVETPVGTYRMRTMVREEVDLAVAWATAEGWNPGLHDAACFYAADPGGFYIGELAGEPVATVSLVRYNAHFAFGGFYIVAAKYRGMGLGLRLFDAVWAGAADANIGGDGVVEQQENYRKSGMMLSYRNIRFEGKGGGVMPAGNIVSLAEVPFSEVLAYDTRHFPAPRPAFLRAWLDQPGIHAFACAGTEGLKGFGVIRPCVRGWKVGPLFADTPEGAHALFQAMASRVPAGAPIFLDVPEPNESAVALAAGHGMSKVFETGRLYTKSAPAVPLAEIYGITSFELG